MKLAGQFLRFSTIGAAGFVVDISILYLMLYMGLDLYSARVISFVAAATSTWIGNRLLTFRPDRKGGRKISGEWVVYLAAMTVGGLVNYGIYALLIGFFQLFHDHPWLAVAGGTGAGLLINFMLARRILYKAGD